tara:strand:+ start:762 stop:1631 length:870 start_codon:yes stop_codon:yes gene_type:complete
MKKNKEKSHLENWDIVIKPQKNLLLLNNFKELIKYKDLIYLLIKRDFTTYYKQTILGPLWYILQPLLNTIVFTVIFGNFAKIPTDGIPPFLFYLAGSVVWSYFSTCVQLTGNIFVTNSSLFSKVYFPRMTIPFANIVFSLVQFLIQFTFFSAFLIYFSLNDFDFNLKPNILYTPLIIFHLAILCFGVGTLLSSLCSKYRDLSFVIGFGIQLWMFATPIVYPLSVVPEKYHLLMSLNPMTSIVECFRYIYLGTSSVDIKVISTSIIVTLLFLFFGTKLFQKVEKNFIDTV